MSRSLARWLPYGLSFFSSLCIMVLELVASRLVAQHVGASLIVWTSVIGIMLGGICLGNVLGGRLADRVEPVRALGPLYALGAALTVGCLWVNALVGFLPGLGLLPWDLRTLVVVTLDFLVPATVLGMISPVVAKIAVEEAKQSGSAIGDVYFLGAVGSIVGTFLAGFWLIYIASTSTIVTVVAAALALLAGLLTRHRPGRLLGLATSASLAVGAFGPIATERVWPGLSLGDIDLNAVTLVGHALAAGLAVMALRQLRGLIRTSEVERPTLSLREADPNVRLGDLATLAFLASLAFMALEMVAGRLVTRHLGSSVFGWTSVIGILLGGLSLGNYLGGKLANRIRSEKQASHLFLAASVLVSLILLAETPPTWLVRNPIGYFLNGQPPVPLAGDDGAFLSQAIEMAGYPWWFRVLFWTGVVFLVPSLAMGTVSPLVAKLAVDRVRGTGHTGTAIGAVYAWGMVGSLVGTFLTGFVLIDWLGTKGVILVITSLMALAATALGTVGHAAWAGIPLGLCLIAFGPAVMPEGAARDFFLKQGRNWGLREKAGDPSTVDGDLAYVDESNYYFIKVNNERDREGIKRELVLDNLIHGYVVMGQPDRLDYDYEHIYALVTHRMMQAKAQKAGRDGPKQPELGALFLGGGSYTFPRYLQALYPRTWCEVAEIDPAVTRANQIALGLPGPDRTLPEPKADPKSGQDVVTIRDRTLDLGPAGSDQSRDAYLTALEEIAPPLRRESSTGEGVATIDGTEVRFGPFGEKGTQTKYIDALKRWYATSKYTIKTTWGDARQYVERHPDKQFDVVYGDAFNDFSVPWHLTTKQFNEGLARMLTPEGVYMINIIDVYESDARAAGLGPRRGLIENLVPVLSSRWNGRQSAEPLAEDLIDAMLTPEIQEKFDTATRVVAEALAADPRPMTRAELMALAESACARVEAPRLNSEGNFAKTALGVLAQGRARDVVTVVEDVRSSLARRYRDRNFEDPTLAAVLTLLNAVRSGALTQETAADRVQIVANVLTKAQELARALATSEARGLKPLFEQVRERLLLQTPDEPRKQIEAAVVLTMLNELGTLLNPTGGDQAPEMEQVLAGETTRRVAGQVAQELEGLRNLVTTRHAAILESQQGDEPLAIQISAHFRRFGKIPAEWAYATVESIESARRLGGFLGSWINTARQTFPHVYVFGTHSAPGKGSRETFVVVVSRQPLDLAELGERAGDPQFELDGRPNRPKPYPAEDMKALEIRSRGIVLTDDYAPVENLLAPVAETRGRE